MKQFNFLLFEVISYSILSLLLFVPALFYSILFLIRHLFFLFFFFFYLPFSPPSVTIATEERPFFEKGIRLAGPPSHLARRGWWGGGRSSGSMFRSDPLSLHCSLCHCWPLTLQLYPLAHRWSCEAAWECCATDYMTSFLGCSWHHTMLCNWPTLQTCYYFCWVTAS